MDIILVVLLVLLVGIASAILYLNLKSKPKDDNWDNFLNELLLAPLVTTKRVMPLFLALSNVEIIPGTNSGPTLMTPNASNNKASK